jgi:hypothetical protein
MTDEGVEESFEVGTTGFDEGRVETACILFCGEGWEGKAWETTEEGGVEGYKMGETTVDC